MNKLAYSYLLKNLFGLYKQFFAACKMIVNVFVVSSRSYIKSGTLKFLLYFMPNKLLGAILRSNTVIPCKGFKLKLRQGLFVKIFPFCFINGGTKRASVAAYAISIVAVCITAVYFTSITGLPGYVKMILA